MFGKIFEEIQSKDIEVKDIDGNSHVRNLKNFRFRIGVYGLLIKDNKILIQIHPYTKKIGLPGGAVDMGETLEDALKREFVEETNLTIKVKNIFDIEEQFFTNPNFNEDAHSFFIFYKVERISGELITNGNGDDVLEAKYINIKDLNKDNTEKYMWKILKYLRSEMK